MDNAYFWWKSITGPRMIVSGVLNAVSDGRAAVFRVPSDLPWRRVMRGVIQEEYQQRMENPDVIVDALDMVDDDPNDMEPGRFLLDRFASREVKAGYREKMQASIQEYICKHEVLRNRVIWLKALSGKKAAGWIEFCRKYPKMSAKTGLFVLEVHGIIQDISGIENLKLIDFDEIVSSWDVQLFDNVLLDTEGRYSDTWKNYASAVSSSLCGTDAEVSAELIKDTDFLNDDILMRLRGVSNKDQFQRRGSEPGSPNVLRYVREGNEVELKHRLWKAQVQVLFPLIEIERLNIIDAYREDIQSALENYYVKQYHEQIADPDDVELGTLCWMMRRWNDNGHVLEISDEDVRKRINFIHECRNKLAHASCCSPEEVKQLLGA